MSDCTCDMHGQAGMHCRACCITLTGLAAFDHHILRGEHFPPADRGLVLNARGRWGFPIDERRREQLAGMGREGPWAGSQSDFQPVPVLSTHPAVPDASEAITGGAP